jgi:hypothetical protein
VRQIKKVTCDLKKYSKNKYDIKQYIDTLSQIKTNAKNKSGKIKNLNHLISNKQNWKLKNKENMLRNQNAPHSLNSKRIRSVLHGSKYSNNFGESNGKNKMNKFLNISDNKIKFMKENDNHYIQNRVLNKNFLKEIKSVNEPKKLSKNNKSMILYREINEWQRNLRSSIPMKKKNNTGYPRIKLNVFLDQINK